MSILKTLIRIGIALTILITMHYYIWERLIRRPGWPEKAQRIMLYALVVAMALIPLSLVFGWYGANFFNRSLAFVGFTWLGTLFLLTVATMASEIIRATGLLVDPERRHFLAKGISLSVSALGFSAGAYGMRTALRPIEVKEMPITLNRLPKSLDGFTIIQLTDTHIGPTIRKEFIEDVVTKSNAQNPDIIVLTGDIVDGSVENLRKHTAPLAELKAKHGVYFVTGNHEYYSGADEWIAEFQRLGIGVLRNERLQVGDGNGLDLVGIDDWSAHNFGNHHGADLKRALQGREKNRPCVLLAHNPMAGTEAIEAGVDLMLSGHTHGGQIWPFNNAVRLLNRWVVGLYHEGDTQIYVSPGTGYWGPPMRIGTSAEISRIVLHSPKHS